MRLGRPPDVLLDRYCTIDMAGKYLFLFLKPSSYLKFKILCH
jgi:hypothetical protein